MRLINLPNILTLINLFSGCIAIVLVFNYYIEWVPLCILVSLVADFFDGMAARFTKTTTDIGKQLDSLADVMSFGVVPGAILFELLMRKYEIEPNNMLSFKRTLIYCAPAFLVTMGSALRLAKFNIDTRQTSGFLGLPTPAMGIFVAGILLIYTTDAYGLANVVAGRKVIYAVSVILPLLMISDIPMFSFKFSSFGWKGNEVRYLFIILCVVLGVTLKFAAISLIIILYILISISIKLLRK